MTSFATPLELSTMLNGNNDLTSLSAEWIRQAALLLEMISDDVEEAAGIQVDAGSGAVVLAGTWSDGLELPAGPVRSVDGITVDGVTVAAGWWHPVGSTLYRGPAGSLGALTEDAPPAQGAAPGGISGWGGPDAAVAVVYSWGFDTVPAALRSLTLRIAGRTIGNVTQVTQESLGSYSVTYGARGDDGGSHVRPAERRRLRRLFHAPGGTIRARA